MVSTLTRLSWRDLWRMRAQAMAAVLVVACGVASFVAMRSTYLVLLRAQQDYYASHRFADLFVHLKRAPLAVATRIAALPGVAAVGARVVADVTLDVPGLAEPATGHVVSVPERGGPSLDLLHLQRGRYVAPDRDDEVLVSAAFAEANQLRTGQRIGAVLNGRWKQLRIVGIAISPEYVYETGAGSVFPDNRHYGVLWMGTEAVSAAFRMDGAFNDLMLSLDGGAIVPRVIAQVDRELASYGGLGTITREDQVSNRFISDEIAQNRITATYVPAIFFFVTMFLLQNVLNRLVDTQRAQIGLMKAFGYGNARVALHYFQFACLIAAAGAAIGYAAGLALGSSLTALYARYYRFARLEYHADAHVAILAGVVSFATALVGTAAGVTKAAGLLPVEAMRAPLPPDFAVGWLERFGLYRHLGVTWRMIARNITRQPLKALLSCIAMACASAILVTGGFFFDAVDYLFDVQFQRVERQDVTVAFAQPLSHRAIYALERLPGVLRVEPFRDVPVRISAGYRSRRVSLSGIAPAALMHRLVDERSLPLRVPPDGIVISSQLADTLGVHAGDQVTVEVLEGKRQSRQVTLAGRVGELVGIRAYMDQQALARLLGEGGNWSGAWLQIDARASDRLYAALKRMPAVNAVAVRRSVIDSFRKIMNESVRLSTSINFTFACIIAFGVAFNGMRIAYSERLQQLASLRVLGFTRMEVAWILLGEQFLLAALATPAGLLLGYGVCAFLVDRLATDLYRLPLVVQPATFAQAFLVTASTVTASGWLVARKIGSLDIVAVLKARES
ncbi:ABC transporter permease [Burkholderia cenocepacia]|uniref:ABC transporter permease n=1 Tax=Burkholderia cenocepacia TaxID=95486 RepID=UPI000D0C6B52|nr:FtsX-like permease family protein [Burkholderia cenocepacia]SOT41404.1 putative Permease, domain protein [Burkholderia cenocepacia]